MHEETSSKYSVLSDGRLELVHKACQAPKLLFIARRIETIHLSPCLCIYTERIGRSSFWLVGSTTLPRAIYDIFLLDIP